MSIQIPHEVATFLNFVGVPYPDIDEDQVRLLADHVRTFKEDVRNTHSEMNTAIDDLGSHYSGYSYSQLVAAWGRMSGSHMSELDRACGVVATALRAAAEVITAAKVAVLAELAVMAASYATAMAATVATSGLSLAVTEAIRLAARRLLEAMEQALIGYVLAEVVGKAIEPLEHAVERMIGDALHHGAADLLGPPSSGPPRKLFVDLDEVLKYAQKFDGYADDMLRHARDFADRVAGLTFTTGTAGLGPTDEGIGPPPSAPDRHAPDHDAPPSREIVSNRTPSAPETAAGRMPNHATTPPPQPDSRSDTSADPTVSHPERGSAASSWGGTNELTPSAPSGSTSPHRSNEFRGERVSGDLSAQLLSSESPAPAAWARTGQGEMENSSAPIAAEPARSGLTAESSLADEAWHGEEVPATTPDSPQRVDLSAAAADVTVGPDHVPESGAAAPGVGPASPLPAGLSRAASSAAAPLGRRNPWSRSSVRSLSRAQDLPEAEVGATPWSVAAEAGAKTPVEAPAVRRRVVVAGEGSNGSNGVDRGPGRSAPGT